MPNVTKAVLGTVFAQVAEANSKTRFELAAICRSVMDLPGIEEFTYDPGSDIVLVDEIGMRWPGHLGITITVLNDDIAVLSHEGMSVIGRLPGDNEKLQQRWDVLSVAMQAKGVMIGSPALLVVNYDPAGREPPGRQGPDGLLLA